MFALPADLTSGAQQGWEIIVLLISITVLLFFVGTHWRAKRIRRSVSLLEQQTKEIADGNYETKLNIGSKDDLYHLAFELEQMKQAVLSRELTLSNQAYFDLLTQLPNRLELSKKLIQLTKNTHQSFALIRISPQRFTDVSFSLGHSVGDQIIKTLAERLLRISQPEMLFNIGGSSFVLLVKNVKRLQMDKWLEKIVNITDLYFSLRDISLHIQVQLGIAMFPKDDTDGISLLEKASMALQYAKKMDCRNCFMILVCPR